MIFVLSLSPFGEGHFVGRYEFIDHWQHFAQFGYAVVEHTARKDHFGDGLLCFLEIVHDLVQESAHAVLCSFADTAGDENELVTVLPIGGFLETVVQIQGSQAFGVTFVGLATVDLDEESFGLLCH
jgi:hypothetical protein